MIFFFFYVKSLPYASTWVNPPNRPLLIVLPENLKVRSGLHCLQYFSKQNTCIRLYILYFVQ